MSNTYQKNHRRAQPDPVPGEVAVPEQVIVSMAEIAGAAKEGLLALAVSTGLQVMAAMFGEDAEHLCGPQSKHNRDRAGYRHGSQAGSVTSGGRRVAVTRPRVRAADGSGELHLPSYDLFSSTEVLGRLAMEKMLAGLSSRRYPRGLEPAGQAVEAQAASTSKSAVSRRFAAATETALAELMSRRLDDLDLVAFMVDGVHFGEHTCVVALGIGIDGTKHPLGVEEGSTENAAVVTDLIAGLRDRGLDTSKPILAVLDGAKALSKAIRDVFDKPVIHRCQQHKIRNVIDKLPGRLKSVTEKRMRQAYHAESALKAGAELTELARELGKTHPGAAASLREGMTETLTVLRLEVPPALARTLRSTNTIESMIEICREHSKNVKRWRDGTMALRWCAAGMIEAGKQFRRVNGHLHLTKLRAALKACFTENVSATCQDETVRAA
ncbi:MAG TPA: IS256 family transposase [Streptosporangiaceae bacterium]|nr:IS256 family transposase [Streptosporangiaceae bacterium]